MRNKFKDLSIRQKLMVILMVASVTVLLLSSVAFLIGDAFIFWKVEKGKLSVLADIIGKNTSAAIAFNDQKAAQQTLEGLNANPYIVMAYIVNKEGRVFAQYFEKDVSKTGSMNTFKTHTDLIREAQHTFWSWDFELVVAKPIFLERQIIGTVVIQSTLGELVSRLRWLLSVILLIMAGTLTIAFFLSARLQHIISRPILHLTQKMKIVSEQKDYTVRGEKESNDETGVLIGGFNEMLAQIQERDEENIIKAEISRIISSTLDLDEVCNRFAMVVGRLIPFDRLAVLLLSGKDKMALVYSTGIPVENRRGGEGIFLDQTIYEQNQYKSAVLIPLRDADEIKKENPTLLANFETGIRSFLSIPLISKDQLIGSLVFQSLWADAYSSKEIRIAETLGSQIAGAIANAKLFIAQQKTEEALRESEEISRQLAQENNLVAEIGRIISSTLDLDEVYDRFAEEMKMLIPFDCIAVSIVDREKGINRIVYATRDIDEGPTTGDQYPFTDSVSREVLEKRLTVIIHAKSQEIMVQLDPHLLKLFENGLQSMIIAPLICREEQIGTLMLFSMNHLYTEKERGVAERIGNQIAGAIANAQLFTERKKAEEALQEKTEELARSNRDLEQFAYVASHDLQEPLRMVTNYVQLLAKRYQGKLDVDADDFIHFAVDGAVRMWKLINDLLAYSRVETRTKALESADCEMILKQSLENLKMTIEENHAMVTNDPLPTVLADSPQFVQLFQNLIGNAIKFHGSEPPRIHISVRQNGNGWTFSVHDNGIGIAPEYAERIFIIFQRLHSREKYTGTGIGLSICKKIVERHGGRIWVESDEGKGATFFFTVPLNREKNLFS